MLNPNSWWKEIFSGELSIGLNEQKVHQIHDESFLFYSDSNEHILLKESAEDESHQHV